MCTSPSLTSTAPTSSLSATLRRSSLSVKRQFLLISYQFIDLCVVELTSLLSCAKPFPSTAATRHIDRVFDLPVNILLFSRRQTTIYDPDQLCRCSPIWLPRWLQTDPPFITTYDPFHNLILFENELTFRRSRSEQIVSVRPQ